VARPKKRKPSGKELVLRVADDDESLNLSNADPLQVLAFASAYLESLFAIAADLGTEVHIEGLELRAGSVELVTHVDKLGAAQAAARELARTMMMPEVPAPLRRLRSAVAKMPEGVHAEIRVGKWESVVDRDGVRREQPLRELVVMRATVIRVGGIRRAVRLRAQEHDFSLEADEHLLRALAAALYSEIELEAEVERDALGNIVDGKAINFSLIDTDDPADAWQKWFDENAGDWNDNNAEGVLGRDRD
jgi:hypothetical protein